MSQWCQDVPLAGHSTSLRGLPGLWLFRPRGLPTQRLPVFEAFRSCTPQQVTAAASRADPEGISLSPRAPELSAFVLSLSISLGPL